MAYPDKDHYGNDVPEDPDDDDGDDDVTTEKSYKRSKSDNGIECNVLFCPGCSCIRDVQLVLHLDTEIRWHSHINSDPHSNPTPMLNNRTFS